MKKKSSRVAVGAVFTLMIGVAIYGAANGGVQAPWSTPSAPATQARLTIVNDEAPVSEALVSTDGSSAATPPAKSMVMASGYGQIGPQLTGEPSLMQTPQLATSVGVVPEGAPAIGPDGSAGTPTLTPASNVQLGDVDCTRFERGNESALTLAQLTSLIQTAVKDAGPNASIGILHAIIQAELDRSHDDATVKTAAIEQVMAAYQPSGAPYIALERTFNLESTSSAFPNGYDPCGNPTAVTSGGAFSSGAFSSSFATINPVPVVASKSGAVVEGRPAI